VNGKQGYPCGALEPRTLSRVRSALHSRFTVHCSLFTVLQVAACAHYQPAPVNQPAVTTTYNARHLADPGLLDYLQVAGSNPSDSGWSSRDFALTALYYQPELDRARADWGVAVAGEITAGARPQPKVGAEVERNFAGGAGEPPWGLTFIGEFTIEFGGKRGARIALARAKTAVAGVSIWETQWRTLEVSRAAAFNAIVAEQDLRDARAELEALLQLEPLVQARYEEGSATNADLAQIQTEIQTAALGVAAAEQASLDALAGLSKVVAIPIDQLSGTSVVPDSISGCRDLGALPRDSIQTLAVQSRWNVGLALAEYQVSEADLRVEIAGQYPDLNLSPGLRFDHGISRWLIGFALPSLPLNGNRGPIAEAEARRVASAVRVAEVQESVLADLGAARSGCVGARAGLAAADSLAAAIEGRTEVARGAYERGEMSRTEVAFIELAKIRAIRARHAAEQRYMAAGMALEGAAGVWLTDPSFHWPDPTIPPRPPVTAQGQSQ
jgi:outer membrane protein, heavy metal efflux system